MKSIWKFPLRITDHQQILMPYGARVLSVLMQGSQLCVWAIVDTDAPTKVKRQFTVHGTGNPAFGADGSFVGTVIDEQFVWHVFDGGEIIE